MIINFNSHLAVLLLACLLITPLARAKSKESYATIHGIVKNEERVAVPGCTILNKRTNLSAISGTDGRFAIEAIKSDTLEITHIFYYPLSVVVTENLSLPEIILVGKDVTEEEVIVNTGYQLIPKERSSGAFTVIGNKLLNEQTSPNILDRLRNVSTVFFDNKILDNRKGRPLLIRGMSTINGYADPLIVLDNFPYEGNLDDINPDDVESISILKDATAASIWGAKSANGVIVITTKKGKYNRPIAINLSSKISIGNKPDLSAYPDISIKDYIGVEEYLFNNNFKLGDTSSNNRPPFTPVYEMLLKLKAGELSMQDSASFINDLLSVNPQKEYLDNFYQKAITQQYNLSLSGGSDKHAWLISGSYNHITNNLRFNGSEKKNLRIEDRFKPVKNLELNVGIYYTQSVIKSSPTPTYQSIAIGAKDVPYLRFKDSNGNAIAIDRTLRGGYTDTAGGGQLPDWKYYPLNDYKYQTTTDLRQNWLWQLGVNYSFLKYFSASVNYQQEQSSSLQEQLYEVESFYTRDLINRFAQPTGNPDGSFTFNIPVGDIFSTVNGKSLTRNARAQLNFSRNGRNFSIYALAGGELRESKTFGASSMTIYGYTADPLSYSSVNYNTSYPNYITGSYSTISGRPALGGTNINRFISAYFNTAITYKNRYTFNGSLRRDASNIFGLSTNDKWNPFWSGGIAWNIANEKFYQIQWLSVLKLRATLGIGGNIDPSRTALPVSLTGTDNISNLPIRGISSLNNPLLRWEQSRQLNLAMDIAAFNRRLSGSFDFYFKKSSNLFGPAALDYTTWGKTNTVVKNVASMKGQGFEINLQTQNILKPVEWQTNFILNYNTSKVTDYFIENALGIGYFIQSGGRSIYPVVGKPLYSFAAYRWGGLNDQGDPQGYIGDSLSTDYQKISTAKIEDNGSYKFVGTADPKFFGSLNNTFRYKGFFLSANISYRFNYYFRKPVLQYNQLYYSGKGTRDFENRWQQSGDEQKTNVPAMVYTSYPQFTNRDAFYQFAEINVLRADNIRLEYINAGYTLQTKKSGGWPLKELTIAANVANIGLLWKRNKEVLDPDYPGIPSLPVQYTLSISAGL